MSKLAEKIAEGLHNKLDANAEAWDQRYAADPRGYERKLSVGWAIASGAIAAVAEVAAHKFETGNHYLNALSKGAMHGLALAAGAYTVRSAADYGRFTETSHEELMGVGSRRGV